MTGPKPISEKQLAANRRNAQRSTGPRTAEGKAASRYNALKHGIFARAIIPDPLRAYESPDDFEALHHALRQDLAPATPFEELLVERIATYHWRLARLVRSEAAEVAHLLDDATNRYTDEAQPAPGRRISTRTTKGELARELQDSLDRPERLRFLLDLHDPDAAPCPDDQLVARAQEAIASLEAEHQRLLARRHEVDLQRRAIPGLGNALLYARYEASLERQLNRAIETLRLTQARRQAGSPPPPPPPRHPSAAPAAVDPLAASEQELALASDQNPPLAAPTFAESDPPT